MRIEKENDRIQQQYEQLCVQDAIESFDTLKERLTSLLLPANCRYIIQDECIIFHCFDYDKVFLALQLLVSVVVSNELTVMAYKQLLKINQNHFEHLNQGHVSNGTALVNIIACCSALCNSDNSTDHIQFKLEVAVLSLKQYL